MTQVTILNTLPSGEKVISMGGKTYVAPFAALSTETVSSIADEKLLIPIDWSIIEKTLASKIKDIAAEIAGVLTANGATKVDSTYASAIGMIVILQLESATVPSVAKGA